MCWGHTSFPSGIKMGEGETVGLSLPHTFLDFVEIKRVPIDVLGPHLHSFSHIGGGRDHLC